MVKYTLYTEDRANLAELTSEVVDSFSIQRMDGCWHWQKERSAAIVVLYKDGMDEMDQMRRLARRIKDENNQDAVLITKELIVESCIVGESE